FNPYRFFHTNSFTSTNLAEQNSSFFSFRGLITRKYASAIDANQKDPCALIYPAVLWKTPSDLELRSLTSSSGLVGDLLGDILSIVFAEPATDGATFGSDYIEYPVTAGTNPAYTAATNKLRFNYNGVKTNLDLVEGLINLDLL